MDFETLLGLAGSVLSLLAILVLVLWPIVVAVIEILARRGRWVVLASGLAALAAVAYFGLWLELVSELGVPKA